jgi:hypothetical protein
MGASSDKPQTDSGELYLKMKDPLFQPITINRLVVNNRIYLPAMHLGMAVRF